jgi:hypothetical protein
MTDKAAAAAVAPELNASAAAAAAAPVVEKVTIGGKEFEVSKDAALAIKASQEAATASAREIEQRLNSQIADLTKRVPVTPAEKAAPAAEDYDTLIFTQPKEAVARIKAELKAELAGVSESEKARAQFWTNFYDEFPELKGDELVVNAVASRDYNDLKDLKVVDARKKLGEATQKYLLERGVDRKKAKKGNQVEGGTESKDARSQSSKVSEDSQPEQGGISSVLKQRREARRAAAASGKGSS